MEHSHAAEHEHGHEHAPEPGHEHHHDHAHGHHHHHDGGTASSEKDLQQGLALLRYTVEHNEHHFEELEELRYLPDSDHAIRTALLSFRMGNDILKEYLSRFD